jgi:hypothetical protein
MTDRAAPIESNSFRLIDLARASAKAIERFAFPLYTAVIFAFLLVFLAAAYFLTVEADEAWILLSTMNAFGIPLPATDAVASPTLTSGGLHLLIHGGLALGTSNILAHRLVSLAFALLLLATIFRALKAMGRPSTIALAGTALFAAVPAFIFQASLATAEIIATFLLFSACQHWLFKGQFSYRAAAASGLLFGLSCATRVNCFVALPAILIYAVLSGPDWQSRTSRTVVTIAVATITAATAMAAYYLAARTGNDALAQQFFADSAGVKGTKSPTQLLWAFVISDRIMPMWLIAGICGAFLISIGDAKALPIMSDATRLSALLLLVGLAGLAAWVLKAPIPHVRYLWPAVPCLWFAGIIQLTQPAITTERGYVALAFHFLIFAACGSRLAADALIVANGESLTLVYQANGTSPFELPTGSFHAANDQRALAGFLSAQPPDTRFYGLIAANAYPLTLLSGRSIASIQVMATTGSRYVILSPADVTVWHPDAAFVQWIRTSTRPALVSGDAAAFRVNEDATTPPPPGILRLGDNDIIRHTKS